MISTDVLYNILLQIKTINLTILDPIGGDLLDKNISYLRNFDLVVIDLLDGGYGLAGIAKNFTIALIQYLKEGGALFSVMTNLMLLIKYILKRKQLKCLNF